MNYQHPVSSDLCPDCGSALELEPGEDRCPACFESYLFAADAGFLENYRRFGVRSRLVVAETCLRGLVLDTPEHRKVLAMTIFEQYVGVMNDLVALFVALGKRQQQPILKTFSEFKLDSRSAVAFFDAVQSVSDYQLIASLDLPLPFEVPDRCPHLDEEEAYNLSVAVHHLTQDLRKVTDKGSVAALALAQFAGQSGSSIIASNADWLQGEGRQLTPDQVAMLVLDPKRRAIIVQGLTADENAMGQVVDVIDAATRAASNLIYAYLQANNL